MEAEYPVTDASGQNSASRAPGEPKTAQKPKKVVHVGTGKPDSEDMRPPGYPEGHTAPTEIELRAVNYNYAKHHGGADKKKLDNPHLTAHAPEGPYYSKPITPETKRIRPISSRPGTNF